jgi:hypothetical protein
MSKTQCRRGSTERNHRTPDHHPHFEVMTMASVRAKSKADRGRSTAAKPSVRARSGRNRRKRKTALAPPKELLRRDRKKQGQRTQGQRTQGQRKQGYRKPDQRKQGQEKLQPVDRSTTGRIRGALREFLESERGFLSEAQSLLMCIAQSMDDSTHPSSGPYYPDVVGLASNLLGRRAADLDEMLLVGRLSAEGR